MKTAIRIIGYFVFGALLVAVMSMFLIFSLTAPLGD
jgi:hypothetical protein